MKREIDLVEYVRDQGYEKNKEKSCAAAVVMEKDGHEMIIKQSPEGRWYYWSRNDAANKGTILDFVGRQLGSSGTNADLRAVVAFLREKAGSAPQVSRPRASSTAVRATSFDRAAVGRAFAETAPAATCRYLVHTRCLRQDTLTSPRFRGTWRVDCYGSAVFPHGDEEGICGFEKRGPRWKGFSPGGRKALWVSNVLPADRAIVFAEQGIDALSHYEISGRRDAVYASIGGEPSLWQWEYIRQFLVRHPDLEPVAAFDADAAGDRFAAKLTEIAARRVSRDQPEWVLPGSPPANKKVDWNFLLQSRNERGVSLGRAG